MPKVAFRLHRLLEQVGWTIEDLEKCTGLSFVEACGEREGYTTKKWNPLHRVRWLEQLHIVEYLANLFGVPLAWLAFGKAYGPESAIRASLHQPEQPHLYKNTSVRMRLAREKLGLSQEALAIQRYGDRFEPRDVEHVRRQESRGLRNVSEAEWLWRELDTTPEWLAYGIDPDGKPTNAPPSACCPRKPAFHDELGELKERLSRRVKALRKKRKLSATACARAAGISVAAVNDIEADERDGRIENRVRALLGLGLSLEQIGGLIAGRRWRPKTTRAKRPTASELAGAEHSEGPGPDEVH